MTSGGPGRAIGGGNAPKPGGGTLNVGTLGGNAPIGGNSGGVPIAGAGINPGVPGGGTFGSILDRLMVIYYVIIYIIILC